MECWRVSAALRSQKRIGSPCSGRICQDLLTDMFGAGWSTQIRMQGWLPKLGVPRASAQWQLVPFARRLANETC